MINRLKSLLAKYDDISDYRITSELVHGVELYYVTNKLETNRVKDIASYSVTVYVDFDSFRGDSAFSVSEMNSDLEIEEKIQNSIKAAKLVCNKAFTLPKGNIGEFKCESNILDSNLLNVATKIADAIYRADTYEEGWINSSEIFVSKVTTRIVNSKGVDLTNVNAKAFVEIIPTWTGKSEEVEIYFSDSFSSVNYSDITVRVNELLLDCKARANALQFKAPEERINVIIPTELIKLIMKSLAQNTFYQVVYSKTNTINLGDDLSKENPCKLNITLKGEIDGGCKNTKFDRDGILLKDLAIVKDGKVEALHGDNRFGQYLGVENPTGNYESIELEAGTMSFADMKKKPYVLCEKFSSPQLDEYSGYYGGEIRLGRYFDGNEVKPITGFAISGNLMHDFTNMILSSDVVTDNEYRGPKYILIPDMKIN